MITESFDNTQTIDDKTILEKEINNIFAIFFDSWKTGALFIEIFKTETDEGIKKAKLMIIKHKPEEAQSIISSLTKIAELNAKDQRNKEFIDERVKAFVEIQATKDFYSSRSAALPVPNSAEEKNIPTAVGEHTQREIDRNAGMSSQGSWCSIL